MCEIHKNNILLCLNNFYLFKIDRDDNSILHQENQNLKNIIKCELILFKILMIRLRRRKNEEDWEIFKQILEKNLNFFILQMKTRWLISILDTYIDNGDQIEKRNALIATLFPRNEKIFATLMDKFILIEKNEYFHNIKKDIPGIKITSETADLIINLFNRMAPMINETFIISKIFKEILRRILQNNECLYKKVSDMIENKKIFEKPIRDFIDL